MKYLLFTLGLLLAGCAPDIKPGALALKHVDLPKKLTESNPAVEPSNMTLPESWWVEFHDSDLNHLVDMALSGNPGLKVAKARLELAQASVMTSHSLTSIHANNVTEITKQRKSKNGANSIYSGRTMTIGDVALPTVNYHLDLWHSDSELIASNQSAEQMEAAQLRQSALMLSAAVIKTYFALNTVKQLISVQTEVVNLIKDELNIQDAAFQAGLQPALPLVTQRTNLLDARNALALLQMRSDILRFSLMELLGKKPQDTLPELSDEATIPNRFRIPQRIDLNLIAQRPDIQAALWNIQRSSHLEKVAHAAFYPNINLHALTGFNSIGLSKLFVPGGFAYAFGPAINLPLFEGGYLVGKLHESEATYDMAVHKYNKAVFAAIRQITDAFATLQYTRVQLDNRVSSLELKTSQKHMAESGFRAGITSKLPFLKATIHMDREKMAYMEESLNWLNSITDAATALGGGFGKRSL